MPFVCAESSTHLGSIQALPATLMHSRPRASPTGVHGCSAAAKQAVLMPCTCVGDVLRQLRTRGVVRLSNSNCTQSRWYPHTSVPHLLHVAPSHPCPSLHTHASPQMREQQLLELDALCRSKGIKLLIVRSYGLMGYMRVSCC